MLTQFSDLVYLRLKDNTNCPRNLVQFSCHTDCKNGQNVLSTQYEGR